MRIPLLLVAAVVCSCAGSDPCAGILPTSLPRAVDVPQALPSRALFEDAFVGDGTGTIIFTLSDYPISGEYTGAIYNPAGQLIAIPQGRFADSSHPRALPQEEGFQLLEGDAINVANLVTYSQSGSVIRTTSVPPAKTISSSIDPSGGTLIISYEVIPGGSQSSNAPAWVLSAQRFDASGNERAAQRTIATDPTGQFFFARSSGSVTTTGWMFIAWTTFQDTTPPSSNLHGAWVAPDGKVSSSIEFGLTGRGTLLDVEPLIGGGIAIAATIPPFPYTTHNWIAQIRDGATTPVSAGWLSSFPSTRLAIVRGGRAYAVLTGAPLWDGAFAEQCPSNVELSLAAPGGKICGTVSLPALMDTALSCVKSASSAAVARDGTVVVRTAESGIDSQGLNQSRQLARWWPKLLR